MRTRRFPFPAPLVLLAAATMIAAVTVIPGAARASGGGIVTTVAGKYGRSLGFSGDGGPARSAQLHEVLGMAADGNGNLYIADSGNFRIRKVNPSGIISTFAGGGAPGPGGAIGDGGPATQAVLYPSSIAIDEKGNVYVLDASARIRKISPNGIITTIVGTQAGQSSGDGGPASAATLNTPTDLALDARGNLYILDGAGSEVRKVSPAGMITRFAGLGPGTGGVARSDFSGDGGPAVKAHLYQAEALAVDVKGNVYIADSGHNRIRKVSSSGIITTVAGTGTSVTGRGDGGPAIKAEIAIPYDLAFDMQGNLYVSAGNVRRIDTRGIITTVAGGCGTDCVRRSGVTGLSPDGFPATRTFFPDLRYLAVDGQGNLYLSGQFEVRKVSAPLSSATPAMKKTAHTNPAKNKTAPVSTTKTVETAASAFEFDLAQLAAGRKKLTSALSDFLNCSLTAAVTQAQITSVVGNRQHALAQLDALAAPTAQTARIKTLLKSALIYSIAADKHYRSWIGYLNTQPRCSTARSPDYAAAQREDALATSAKRQFVTAFNPLARQLGRRTWTANQF